MNLYQSPYEPELARTRAAKEFSRVGFALLALNLALTAAAYAMYDAILSVYNGNTAAIEADWWWGWILSLVPLYAVAAPVMLLVLRGLPKAPHNETYSDHGEVKEKSPFTVSKFLLLLVIGMGCMYIGSFIGNTLMGILSVIIGEEYPNTLDSMVSQSPAWMTFIGTVICAPLGEEFLFRKLLIDRTRRWGDLISIAVSAFTFALFHGNLFQFFYAFFIGAILAYIYTRTGKLRWCVAMHAIVNFFGSIFLPWLVGLIPEETAGDLSPFAYTLGWLLGLAIDMLVFGLMIAAVVLVAVLFRRAQLSRGTHPLTVSDSISAAFLNPGMITALAIMGFTLLGNLITPLLPAG